MDLKKIRILSTVSSPCRERCSGHLTAWRASYPVNEADRIGVVDRRNCDPYKQDGELQRGEAASVTRHMQEIAKSILHISLMSCIIHSSDMGL